MTALALDATELPEAPERDPRAGLCPVCGHPLGIAGELHNRYGIACRFTLGRDECKCWHDLKKGGTNEGIT